MLEDPPAYASAFAAFTGVPLDAAQRALAKVKSSKPHDYASYLADREVETLKGYFGYVMVIK